MAICAFLGELAGDVIIPKLCGTEISELGALNTTRLNALKASWRGSRLKRSPILVIRFCQTAARQR